MSIVVSRGEAGVEEFAALGVSKYNTKDFQGAIPDLTKAMDGNSKDNEIFVARGSSYFELKDYEKSVSDLTQSYRPWSYGLERVLQARCGKILSEGL